MMERSGWLLFLLASGLVGCDAASVRLTDVLGLRMVGVEAARTMAGVPVSPLAGVNVVRLEVEGPGMDPVSRMYDFLSEDGGKLPAFPLGPDRQVTVELCTWQCDESVDGDIVARGRTAPTTILDGEPTLQDVFVAPRNAMVPPLFLSGDGGTAQVSEMVNPERIGATVTTLDDGRLLIVGGARKKAEAKTWYMPGDIDRLFDDVEIFDPHTGRFSATSSRLAIGRAFHQAVKLGGPNKKDGRVLIIGGFTQESGLVKPSVSIEIFDPSQDRFELVSENLLGGGRALFTADLAYPDEGVVLILGGLTDPVVVGGTWHLYKVGIGTVAAGPLMGSTNNQTGQVRYNHTMTRVDGYGGTTDGSAFVVVGGENNSGTIAAIEAFRVETDPFSVTADPDLVADLPTGGRTLHSAVQVLGLVYVIGGFLERELGNPTDRIEVFRNVERTVHGDWMFLGEPRGAATAVLMDNAAVLVSGGVGAAGPSPATDLLLLNRECWQEGDPPVERCGRVPRAYTNRTPGLDFARAGALGVFDATRRVLILGGLSDGGLVPEPVLYNPE